MNVGPAFNSIIDWFGESVEFLDNITLEIWTFNISLIDIFSALLILGFIITVFWKGARV